MADLETHNLVKEFHSSSEPLRILDEVSVELNRGENLAVLGPSGSGKSTFLHIVGTLEPATSGSVNLLGTDPTGFSQTQLARFRSEHIGFVFQEHHLLPQLTALENVLVPLVAAGAVTDELADRAKTLLEAVGLADRMQHRPAKLSGGERQRVAVARSLIREPVLVLADEPTGSLDQKNADIIGSLLLEMQQRHNTILICVTHSDRLAESFDRNVRIENGKFV